MNWITILYKSDLYHVISNIELNLRKGTSDIDMCEGVEVGDIIYVAENESIFYRMEVYAVRCLGEKFQKRETPEIIDICDARITHPMMYSYEYLNLNIPQFKNIDKELRGVPQKLTQEAADYLQNIFEHEKEYSNADSESIINGIKTLAIISEW